jgi:hypothetical protein
MDRTHIIPAWLLNRQAFHDPTNWANGFRNAHHDGWGTTGLIWSGTDAQKAPFSGLAFCSSSN